MKIVKMFLVVFFLCIPLLGFAEYVRLSDSFNRTSLGRWNPISGNWKISNGRLVQTDATERMAMITVPVGQSGTMLYEFDVSYIGGGQDDYAGFGMHICVENPSSRRSWGNGRSVLGWVTWDPKAYGSPGGFIQVYESFGTTSMGLHRRVFPGGNIMRDGDLIPVSRDYLKYEYLTATVPVKVEINTRTGEGKFYDPFDPDRYFYPFDLGAAVGSGSYFTLRTNSVSLSVDNVKITKLN